QTINLKPLEEKELKFALDTASYEPGVYTAKAYGKYGGDSTDEKEITFRVGHLYANITRAEIQPHTEQIFKLFIEFENFWNDPVEEVYATLTLKDSTGTIVHTLTTPSASLSPWGKQSLSAFFDGTALSPGSYDAEVILHYQDATSRISFPFIIEKPSNNYSPFSFVLVIILILLAFDYFWLRKKHPSSGREDIDFKL
ncbi:MAG: hypothetical protein AABX72_02450, partial [Nanoarchaeota archaeon]